MRTERTERSERSERARVLTVLTVLLLLCAQDFFKGVDDEATPLGIWYKGIKRNMQRLIALRMARDAESFDHSAPDLYLSHVREMCAALAKANLGMEAAERKHAIKVLWRASGRAGEPTALSYNTLKWHAHFDCAAVESPQLKPSKMKFVLFPAGACRHSDYMIDFGDLLCFQSRDSSGTPEMAYADGETAWLCPSLQGDNSGTKISNFIKALQVGKEGAVKYVLDVYLTLSPRPLRHMWAGSISSHTAKCISMGHP